MFAGVKRAGALPSTRWLATVGLGNVKELPKPKSNTIRRRRSFDPSDNPFLANALGGGGGMSAAENQMRSFMADGGFEGLEGAGNPLPDRHVSHFMSREEAVLNDITDHLTRERDGLNEDDKVMYKKSALQGEIASAKKSGS